ncbi:hypothetical protein PW5551_06595 [Petrotoga sp. 9PW.55.5.1]|uniref:polysaccharide biosynthesis protein n=1 Tax=Petrotoga sp. 9PW.55.5.1 TaxID=1308979 RepID=UPI000DC519BF|nr:polysaccharide biosynthesis protein [Petrotoga sp. 9PW.55.5.1]RAO99018.1 hypothetical protein PW5551_06595 [Petrotoga sp. 9PW.55.5.1]
MDLKKSLMKVFGANFISLIVSVVNGLLIPAFLEIEEYALLKTYTLFISYVGILHFGFLDGIFIKYGGKNKEKINLSQLKYEHDLIFYMQFLLTLISLLIGIILKDIIIIAFSLSIIPINMKTFYSFIFQALGEFNLFAKITYMFPITMLTLNLFFIYIVKINNYIPFVIANLSSYYIIFIVFEFKYRKLFKTEISEKVNYKLIFMSGIFIMLGNLANKVFYSLDRWFVKFLLSVENFAFYSFAISMMSVINVLISSISMTFYPYLSKGYSINQIKKIKSYLIIIGAIASSGYFVLSFIVNEFLQKYSSSLSIIAILFVGFPVTTVINSLYVNLYKVNKTEKKYFFVVLKMVVNSFVFNIIAILISKNIYSIAIATSLSFYFWFFYSAKDFDGLKTNIKEIVFLTLYAPLFLFSSNYMNYINGFLIFFIGIFLLVYFMYKKEFRELINKIIKKPSE